MAFPLLFAAAALAAPPALPPRPVATYSIVARDSATGEHEAVTHITVEKSKTK